MGQKTSFFKTTKFKLLLISVVTSIVINGTNHLISDYFAKKKSVRALKNLQDIATHKSNLRKEEAKHKSEIHQTEEKMKHQHDMEFEELRHKNRMEEIRRKDSGDPFAAQTEIDEDYSPMPSENVGEMVNAPIADGARIKYLGSTFIQNRDIMVLYGPPGIGKSHEVVDLLAEITTGASPRTPLPLKDRIELKYKAYYYDKEPDELEWVEKFNGRMDLDNIERIPCREIDTIHLLKDIKCRLEMTHEANVIIVIDPITNFDIKANEIHGFVGELANIQDEELKSGRNVVFFMNAHAVKMPKDKSLSDLSGSKVWSESVKTVVSLKPIGPNDCFRKLTFEKTKNGKEVTRGTSFILRPENTPHLHLNYDEELTREYRHSGTVEGSTAKSVGVRDKMPKRTGKLANVAPEDAVLMYKMHEEEKLSLDKIAGSIGKKYNLLPQEVSRLINDMKNSRA